MSCLRRLTLFLVGLVIVSIAVCALVYAFAPMERLREQNRPAPTLFVPPR
jgi:hypothetical protein